MAKIRMPKLAAGPPPMGAGAALGRPKMAAGGKAGPVKPRLKTRHLSTAGRSAFGPGAGGAFSAAGGPPDGAAAFSPPAPPSGGGDQGA